MKFFKLKSRPFSQRALLFLFALSGGAYYYLAYHLLRSDFYGLISLYTLLCISSLALLGFSKQAYSFMLGLSILSRLIFADTLPILSDDFYRFIWDGQMLLKGINPYQYLPSELAQNPNFEDLGFNMLWFQALNSPNYYSVYPPVNQLCFLLSAYFGEGSFATGVLTLRLILFLADLGSFFLLRSLLRHYRQPAAFAYFFLIHPLILIEWTGNIHFEGLMFFFILLSLYCLEIRKNLVLSSIALSLAIATKLIPLMFLPLIWVHLGLRKGFYFCIILGISLILIFLPWLNLSLIQNFSSSVELYFQSFEFNASIYYLIRSLGFQVYGYNIISTAGKLLSLMTFLAILGLAAVHYFAKKTSLVEAMLFTLSIYYFSATTVHPWYISTLFGLSLLTPYRYPWLWAYLVFLSYAAYQSPVYHENLWLVALEYICLYTFLGVELRKKLFFAPQAKLNPRAAEDLPKNP